MDFSALAQALLSQVKSLLPAWLPGGRLRGNEYVCSSLNGGKGDSFSVNVDTGAWADFATPHVRGGDLVALYAAINNIKQGDAYKRLAEGYLPSARPTQKQDPKVEVDLVPESANVPQMNHPNLGAPSASWKYKDKSGRTMFYIARYDDPVCAKCGEQGIVKMCPKCGSKQKKIMLPWCWIPKYSNFRNTSWPTPRPLYGLDALGDNPVLVVEGEKSADAAKKIVQDSYDVVTWPNGTNSVSKVDWSPLFGKEVVIWPDADEPGVKAAYSIASLLSQKCVDVKIIGVEGSPEGWDSADALSDGMDLDKFLIWAKPRVKRYEPIATLLPPESSIKITDDQESPLSKSIYSMWDELGIARNNNNVPIVNMDNVIRVFEGAEEFRELVWYDEFYCKYFTKWKSGTEREWNDVDELNLTQFFQRDLGFSKMAVGFIHEAVMVYAHKRKRNEPKNWLSGLVWDKKPRIDKFFVDCMGASNDEYTRTTSKNWWISMVGRVLQPGCKVDSMVVFEGAQGTLKSTALSVIGGKWFTEAHESVTSKDFFMTLQGRMIVEISELDAFSKAEVNTIKKVITCQNDRFRPPYGRATMDFPRQCVFVGTTNEDTYLRDNTGARRFWPIKISTIDIARIRNEREQLFAEAVERFNSGEIWHEVPKEAIKIQEMRRQGDEWEWVIAQYMEEHPCGERGITLAEIADKALFIHIEKLDRMIQIRIGRALRAIGYENFPVWKDERCIRAWRPKNPAHWGVQN